MKKKDVTFKQIAYNRKGTYELLSSEGYKGFFTHKD